MVTAASATANDFLERLPKVSTVVSGYAAADSVRARLAEAPLTAVEGLWQMLDGGATVCVERYIDPSLPAAAQPATFRMVMVDAPDRHVRPGTVVGYVTATVKPDTYEARMYTDLAERTGLSVPHTFYLKLSGDEWERMDIEPKRSRYTLNPWRLLPYMYRSVVRVRDNKPENLDGAVRVYPPSAANPLQPIYL